MGSRHPAWEIVYKLEMDARALSAKLSELRQVLASLELPEPLELACPICGIKTKGPKTLSEHLYISHEGVVPPQWVEADRLSE